MNHNHKYDDLLLEMESFGKMNDASIVDRSRKIDTQYYTGIRVFYKYGVKLLRTKNILEIGTSNLMDTQIFG